MDSNLIPRMRDDVHISRVKTSERVNTVLYVASEQREITPNEPTTALITLCDGTHTLEEIVSYFVEISGEPPSVIERRLEEPLKKLMQCGVLEVCEVTTPREIPPPVELIYPLREVTMELTNVCNLNCLHCYNDAGKERKDQLTLKEIYQVIDEMKRLGVLRVTLSGGEPLMHPHFFEIAQYIKDRSLGLELFTNGTLLTRDVAKKLKDLQFIEVNVSIESLTPEIHDFFRGKKGAWKKTMEALQNLKAEGIKVKPAVSVFQLNQEEVIPLCEFFVKEGFPNYRFMAVFATGRGKQMDIGISPEDYEKTLKTIFLWEKNHNITSVSITKREGVFNCGVGRSLLVMKSNGDVSPCPAFGWSAVVGSIREQSLQSIWNDSVLLNSLRALNIKDHPVCGTCDLLEYCNGGCPANVCLVRGALEMYDPYTCAGARARKYIAELTR